MSNAAKLLFIPSMFIRRVNGINHLIHDLQKMQDHEHNRKNEKTIHHFVLLRQRLMRGHKLTKKMRENLAAIDSMITKGEL